MQRSTLSALVLGTLTAGVVGCVHPSTWLARSPAPRQPQQQEADATPAASPVAVTAAAPREEAKLADEVAFYDLMEAHGLEVSIDLVTGRRVCTDDKNEVVVMPSRDYLVINGREYQLSGMIRWRDGVLYLPGEARAILAETLRLVPIPDVAHDPELFDGRELSLGEWQRAQSKRAAARRQRTASEAAGASLPSAWKIDSQRRWRYIVIHHSATEQGGAKSFGREHAKKWQNGLGYHFVVGNGTETQVGEVQVGTRWLRQDEGVDGAHAGNKRYNKYGIGICLVGDFNQGRPMPGQLVALRRLCRALMARYDIPASRVYRHQDVRRGHTDCPGGNFPFQAFVNSL